MKTPSVTLYLQTVLIPVKANVGTQDWEGWHGSLNVVLTFWAIHCSGFSVQNSFLPFSTLQTTFQLKQPKACAADGKPPVYVAHTPLCSPMSELEPDALSVSFLLQPAGGFSRSPLRSNACVTMIFLGKSVHLSHDDADCRDEIKVYQQHCGGENLCVYKGRLMEGGKDGQSDCLYWCWQHPFLGARILMWYQTDFSRAQSRSVLPGFLYHLPSHYIWIYCFMIETEVTFSDSGGRNLEDWFKML